MSKSALLKIGSLSAVLAMMAAFYGLKTEEAAAQTTKRTNAAASSKSLCGASEQTIWSCATTAKNKIASVCASKDLAEDKGYVQYRFGAPGKVELEFPQERRDSAKRFKYSRYTRPLVTMLKLKFENAGVVYEIHDDDNSEEKPPVRAASIDIADGAKESSVACRLPAKGSLMKLESIVPRDDEN